MYNEGIKNKFLKTLEKNKNYKNIVSLMNRISKYEEILKKDFYEMNLEEYIYVFRQLDISNTQTLDLYKGFLDRYIKWCIEEGLIEDSPLLESLSVKKSIIIKSGVKSKYLKNKEELESLLKKVYDDEGNYYKFQELIFYLCWEGFSTNKITRLKKSDVNFSNSTIKGLQVDKSTMDLCKVCINLKKAYTKTPRGHITSVEFVDSPYLIRRQSKGASSDPSVDEYYIQNIVHRMKKKLKDDHGIHSNLTLRTILTSGVFAKWVEIENNGGCIEDHHIAELRYLSGQEKPLDRRGFLRYSRYTLRDYNAYKSAFYAE